MLKKFLIFYNMRLHKHLSFNTLIWNGIFGLRPTRQAMLLVKS